MGQTALQTTLSSLAVIASNEPVIFNNIKYESGNVSYSTVTGELILSAPGRYVINWWLAIQSSPSTNGAAFALVSSQGDQIIGNSPIKTDEIYGIGIIEVAVPPVTLSIKNIGTGPMYLSSAVPLQGTLVLFEDSLEGTPGPTGPTGPAAATIPFSIGSNGTDFTAYENGYPNHVCFSGFGKQNLNIELPLGEWETGTITFTEDMQYGTNFIIPYDGILKSLYMSISPSTTLEYLPGVIIKPFICIATCNTDEMIYVIRQETMTFIEPYVGGNIIPQNNLRKASTTNLNIQLPAGTMVAIIMGIMSENTDESQYAYLNASGGLFIE